MVSKTGILQYKRHRRDQGGLLKIDVYNRYLYVYLLQYNDKSVITIRRNGSATLSPLEVMQNDHIYSGIQNELILSQIYTTSFTCEYDMRTYPFDMQKCSMIFMMQV